jgi:hypothetical protein
VACSGATTTDVHNTQIASVTASLSPRLDAVYAAIKSHMAAGGRVVVLGYPHLFSTASCLGTTGITATERSYANLLSDEIDRVISQHATAAGFTYQSAIAAFTGHAVCSSSAWLNGLNIFNTTESFHPTRSGQSSGYLALVRQVVG